MNTMKKRREKIVELINEEGTVSLKKLKESFAQVSEMTLRRDLEYLDQKKEIIRVHGGAKSVEILFGTDDLYMRRSTRNLEEKKEIAQKAIVLLNDNMALFLDSGTTLTEVAKIFPDNHYMIFTNSLTVIAELAKLKKPKINMIGGTLNPFSLSLDGVRSIAELENINFQTAFIGVSGYIQSRGFTTGSQEDAELKRRVINKSEKVVLLMDSQKVGITSNFTFAKVDEIDVIITDESLDEESRKEFESKNILIL